MSHVAAFVYAHGYLGVFSLLMLGIVGIPVPDEWLLAFAGYLVYKGHFHPVPLLATAALGSVCGITVSYGLGRTVGIFVVRRFGAWLHLTEERIERVRAWFDRTGHWALLIGYFVPGVRHLVGFLAGTSRLRYPVFALFAYTGAVLWSVTFVAVGYFSGREWARTGRAIHRDIVIAAVLAAAIVLAYLAFRNRRRRGD